MERLGYAKIASFMGDNPDLLILRSFDALRAQNLLYLQAELVTLEETLHRYAAEDVAEGALGDADRERHARDWYTLVTSRKGRQWKTIKRIRRVLDEYNEALLSKSALVELQRPTRRELNTLRNWLTRESSDNREVDFYSTGSGNPLKLLEATLLGSDADVWEQDGIDDLVVAMKNRPVDSVSALVTQITNKFFEVFEGGGTPGPNVVRLFFTTSLRVLDSVDWILRTVTITVFALLPVAAIVVLYVVTNPVQRLGLVAVFTAGFSLVVRIAGSKVRTIEVFAATAAFAAVQIVFINPRISSS